MNFRVVLESFISYKYAFLGLFLEIINVFVLAVVHSFIVEIILFFIFYI